MYIRLLVPFALHVFVLTHVSNGGYLYNIPANSSETLYLVGYSSELNNSNINCVKSEYRDPRSSNVRRILSMTVYNTTTGQSDLTAFVTFIDIPESPIISSINITEHTGRLVNLTGVLTSYKVIYYNNDTMILGNQFANLKEWLQCTSVGFLGVSYHETLAYL
ncbi:uncharacterized protein LOC142591084 isoform X6 [Dermacentor variabilis]|uniref:uncharacterized protein LOC142591084 isoform X6 n=1 Tax=Dermacentor variabilis TaxID=34621 RepID=UPI003F5C20DD